MTINDAGFNGFHSLFELVKNFENYTENNPDYENDWMEKILQSYQKNKKLSDKQTKILCSIATQIGIFPGYEKTNVG